MLENAQRLQLDLDRLESRRGMQLVKGTGTATLAPGSLGAVRERLSMPAPAEFEEHDPWALRCFPERAHCKLHIPASEWPRALRGGLKSPCDSQELCGP